MKSWALGDIHGRYHAVKYLLTETEFDMDEDTLITLGDICDCGRFTKEVIDLLLSVPNRISVIGNHDRWCFDWMRTGIEIPAWTTQGGYETLESYEFSRNNVPVSHIEFLEQSVPYFIDEKNNIFVHGGFNPKAPIQNQTVEFITWDRSLIKYAQTHAIPGYRHVFVGHTSTQSINRKRNIMHPRTFHNLTMCDCGGGWTGRLALVDVEDPKRYFMSEKQIPGMMERRLSDLAFGVKTEVYNPMKDPNW